MQKVKLFITESWLLIVAAILFGSLLAFTSAAWAPRIRQNEIDKFNRLAGGLIDGATDFEPLAERISIPGRKGKTIEVEVKRGLNAKGQPVGWAFVAVGSGFADKIRLVAAVDADFETLRGFGVLSSNETPGFGDQINQTGPKSFGHQFIGAPAQALNLVKTQPQSDTDVAAISGATVTSQAVVDTLNSYVVPIKKSLKEQGFIQ